MAGGNIYYIYLTIKYYTMECIHCLTPVSFIFYYYPYCIQSMFCSFFLKDFTLQRGWSAQEHRFDFNYMYVCVSVSVHLLSTVSQCVFAYITWT